MALNGATSGPSPRDDKEPEERQFGIRRSATWNGRPCGTATRRSR